MRHKTRLKLLLDAVMTILMLLTFAYQLTGNMAHEVLGMVVFALFVLHNLLNKRWYSTLQKGKYAKRRKAGVVVNLLFLLAMAVLVVSSVLISRDVFGFLHLEGGAVSRQLHILASYWGLIFLSMHLGLHWSMVIRAFQSQPGAEPNSRARQWASRMLALFISAYGVFAFIELEIGQKLILYYSFGYWDFGRDTLLFFIDLLAVMGLIVCLTYYSMKTKELAAKASQGAERSLRE